MTRLEESRRGVEAQRIVENPLVKETLEGMRQAIISKWEQAPMADHQGHHELKIMLKLLNDFEANFKQIITSGKLADFEIEGQRKREELKNRTQWKGKA